MKNQEAKFEAMRNLGAEYVSAEMAEDEENN